MIISHRVIFTLLICLAVFAAGTILVIYAGTARALNTNSIDLEKDSGQYLSIADASQNGALDITGDMTIEVSVKFESLPASGQFTDIIAKSSGSTSDRQYTFQLYNNGGNYNLLMYYSDGTQASADSFQTNSVLLSVGTWYHFAVRVTPSTENIVIFKDGVALSGTLNQNGNTSINNSSAPFQIGYNSDGYFDGLIDEVRIWNIARTETEINDDKSRELNGNESGLVGYWKLNNSLADSTSNANTLTNNGSAAFSSDTPFSGFAEVLKVKKTGTQTVTNSTTLVADSDLKLSLAANTTYILDGVIFASSTSATPDIGIAFFGQTGSDIRIGYTNDTNEMVLDSGVESSRIALPANTPTSIHLHGTVTTSSTSGDFVLKWAQMTANAAATAVLKGSYLRAEAI